jgi:hypothetical protein
MHFLVLYPVIQTQETILRFCVQTGDIQNTSQKCHPSEPTKQTCHPAHTRHPFSFKQHQSGPGSIPGPVHVGFLVDKMALGQVYIPVPYSTIHQRRDVILTQVKSKVHPCTGTEALYRPYGP